MSIVLTSITNIAFVSGVIFFQESVVFRGILLLLQVLSAIFTGYTLLREGSRGALECKEQLILHKVLYWWLLAPLIFTNAIFYFVPHTKILNFIIQLSLAIVVGVQLFRLKKNSGGGYKSVLKNSAIEFLILFVCVLMIYHGGPEYLTP